MTGTKALPDTTATEVESSRLAAVRRFEILDTPPDGVFNRVAAVAARIFDVPMATVTIVDEDRIWFKATEGYNRRQFRRRAGLWVYVRRRSCRTSPM